MKIPYQLEVIMSCLEDNPRHSAAYRCLLPATTKPAEVLITEYAFCVPSGLSSFMMTESCLDLCLSPSPAVMLVGALPKEVQGGSLPVRSEYSMAEVPTS